MTPLAALSLASRVWPAVAGTAGAIWFLSQHQPQEALTVFVGGLAGGHILHSTTAAADPSAPAAK